MLSSYASFDSGRIPSDISAKPSPPAPHRATASHSKRDCRSQIRQRVTKIRTPSVSGQTTGQHQASPVRPSADEPLTRTDVSRAWSRRCPHSCHGCLGKELTRSTPHWGPEPPPRHCQAHELPLAVTDPVPSGRSTHRVLIDQVRLHHVTMHVHGLPATSVLVRRMPIASKRSGRGPCPTVFLTCFLIIQFSFHKAK